jgi:hypothetical protein
MKLTGYGPGEITDRLTILSLKLLFGAEANRDLSAFRDERTKLLSQIRSRTLNGAWFDGVLELAAINAALWHAEDDLRLLRSQEDANHTQEHFYTEAARCGFRVQGLNDQRAQVIERINKDAGEGSPGEKVFRIVANAPEELVR